jgi:hypothetical protein
MSALDFVAIAEGRGLRNDLRREETDQDRPQPVDARPVEMFLGHPPVMSRLPERQHCFEETNDHEILRIKALSLVEVERVGVFSVVWGVTWTSTIWRTNAARETRARP